MKKPRSLVMLATGILLLGGSTALALDTPENLLYKGDFPAFGRMHEQILRVSFEGQNPPTDRPGPPIVLPKDGGVRPLAMSFDAGPAGLTRFPVGGALAGARGGSMSTPKYRADREIRKLIRRLG